MSETKTGFEAQLGKKALESLETMRMIYRKKRENPVLATELLQQYAAFSPEEIFLSLKRDKDTHLSDPTSMNTGQNEPWRFYAAHMQGLLEVACAHDESVTGVSPELFVKVLQLIVDHLKQNKVGEFFSKIPVLGAQPAQARIDCQTFLEMGKQLVANRKQMDTAPIAPISHPDDDAPLGQHGQGVKLS